MNGSSVDFEEMKGLLVARRAELLGVAESGDEAARPVELDQTRVGRVSRMDALQGQAMAQESRRRHRIEIARIEAALVRIEEGEFGHCLACDAPIPVARLRVDPAATQCITCAGKAEQR